MKLREAEGRLYFFAHQQRGAIEGRSAQSEMGVER
jgi:hypothetical protein